MMDNSSFGAVGQEPVTGTDRAAVLGGSADSRIGAETSAGFSALGQTVRPTLDGARERYEQEPTIENAMRLDHARRSEWRAGQAEPTRRRACDD